MRRARIVRATLGVVLTGWIGSAGCTHNYYYGGVPVACAPGTTTIVPGSSVQYGSVCEVPAQVVGGGTVVALSPGVRSSAAGAPSSRVVVSEPANRPKLSWRRSDPDSSMATTRVEGALDEETTIK